MRSLRWSSLVLGLGLTACPASTPDLCDNGACDAADASADAPTDVLPDVEGCDLSQDPADSPLCIADAVGVFVDATNGLDSNDGSKAKPFKSITGALAKVGNKPRIYVCEGVYAGSVDIASPVSIYGGLTCSWAPGGTRPILQADKSAYGVSITASNTTVVDLEVDAKDGTADGESSIALVASGAQSVTLKRVKLVAGTGKDGKAGVAGSNYTAVAQSDANIAGHNASGINGGTAHVCALCTDGKNSVGGAGGTGGASPGDGTDGTPNLGGIAPVDGKRGHAKPSVDCTGHDGPTGDAGVSAPPPAALGAVASTWSPANGAVGTNGSPGQGAGGGGIDGSNVSGGGGGGGCGGCGGAAGTGGMGGGASIGLLSVGSSVSLVACEITTKQAGNGGAGGAAQAGQLGGFTGNGSPPGCYGGTGGTGGGGGTGAGGAGGVSAPIVFKGTAPNADADTQGKLTPGAKGNKGAGGTPGTNDGVDGLSQATFECKAPQCN